MSTHTQVKFCRNCGGKKVHIFRSTNHLLHLILTLMSFGIWGVIWLSLTITNSTDSTCSNCGKQRGILG